MVESIFQNGSQHDQRDILIKIGDEFIEFFFNEQYRRNEIWLQEESERRREQGTEELTEDEAANSNFYWIPKLDWVRDKTERLDRPDNWEIHMMRKSWFTEEMANFINQNTN